MSGKLILYYLLVVIVTIFVKIKCSNADCIGCVELDEITFDKLIKKFKYSLIKFDIAFPYGAKHEAFGKFAMSVSGKVDELLVGLVGVKDYGNMENSAISNRYNLNEKEFPAVLFFKNYSTQNWIQFPSTSEFESDNFRMFINENSDLYIACDRCVEALDILADGFNDKSQESKIEVLKEAEDLVQILDNENDIQNSHAYLIIMKRIIEKGSSFVTGELSRIQSLLKGKIGNNKKRELIHRQNILQLFARKKKLEAKIEL